MTTPHTSGDSVAAPTISEEDLDALLKYAEENPSGLFSRPIAAALRDYKRLRSASAAPVEGVAECEWCEGAGTRPPMLGYWTCTHCGGTGLAKAPAAEAPTGEKVEAFCICGHALSKHSMSAGVCYKVGCACCSYRAAEAGATRDEQIYAMCAYVRGMECKKCPARVDTLYGNGQPGCHAVAEETLKKARDILRTDTAPTCGVTITEDEREALKYAALELDAASSNSQEPFKATCAIHADTLRSLAARLSKGERG